MDFEVETEDFEGDFVLEKPKDNVKDEGKGVAKYSPISVAKEKVRDWA